MDNSKFNLIAFFEGIKDYSLNKSEIVNTVKEITDDFNLLKLINLRKEFSEFLTDKQKLKEAQYRNEDITIFLENLTEDDYDSIDLTKAKNPYSEEWSKELLFYPKFFTRCYQFMGLLNKLIEEEESGPFEVPIKGVDNSNRNLNAPGQDRIEKLKIKLRNLGFFDLKMVKDLSNPKIKSLIDIIASNDIPYQIAMLNYLDFLNHVEKEYCSTKTELYKYISEILNKTDRTVKGNIRVLKNDSKENRDRYTAHQFKETVQKDYQKLM